MNEKEFKFQKELIELESKTKMEALKFIRETEKLKHEWEKERFRIKNAEIKKSQALKEQMRYMNG